MPVVNEQIHAMADGEGVVFVDLYREFGANFPQYIGEDGLHPNTAGYQKVADVFMAAIKSRLELP
jgi:lysophospholipase L1-like esterase